MSGVLISVPLCCCVVLPPAVCLKVDWVINYFHVAHLLGKSVVPRQHNQMGCAKIHNVVRVGVQQINQRVGVALADLRAVNQNHRNLARSAGGIPSIGWNACLAARCVPENTIWYNGCSTMVPIHVSNDLVEALRRDAACLVLKGGQPVARGGIEGNGGLLYDPNTDFRISLVLTTLVALEHHQRTGNFAKRCGSRVVLFGPNVLDLPHIK